MTYLRSAAWTGLLVAVLLGGAGCRKLDLTDGFPCSAQNECPAPYQCHSGGCYRTDPHLMLSRDGGADADGGGVDSGGDRQDAPVDRPQPDAAPPDAFSTSGCDGGSHSCSNVCVDNSSPQHCGDLCVACDQPTGSTATCDGKKCDFTCNDLTQKKCGSRCVSGCCVDADCGMQGTRIGRCDSSTNTCSFNCDATTRPCGSECIAPTACCVPDDCTVMAGQTASCNTGTHQCAYVCSNGYKSCGGGVCVATAGCCTSTECMALAGPGQAATCNPTTHACEFTCTGGTKPCQQICIRSTDCCSDLDCPNMGSQVGHCDTSTRQCSYNCPGQKPCGANVCIATTACCTDPDCVPQTGQVGSCNLTSRQCSFTCGMGFKVCGTGCIPTAACCIDADCKGTTGQVGTCNTTTHSCQFTCDGTHKPCGANTCIPTGSCCTSNDCTPPAGQVGTCNTGTRMCEFTCDGTHKPCGANTCILSTSCCSSTDCVPTIAGQVGTCNTANGTCSFACGNGLRDCNGNSCIATNACCLVGDCPPVAGATPFCSGSTHQCTYTCNANFRGCPGGACIDVNGCCSVTECPVKAGATATCTTSNVCSYACTGGLTDCGGGTCVNLSTGGCCAAGDCAAKTGATAACNSSHQCAYTCSAALRDCGNGVCVASTGCCLAGDCPPRSDATISCNTGHQCVYACTATALKLGCQCTSPGMAACNGPAMKLPVSCVGGQYVAGVSCPSTQNCDQRDGTCHDIVAQCIGQLPGFTFCATGDIPTTCGPDLTTTTAAAACAGLCVGGVCQAPRCGDGKVETGEQCDDGNATPVDGCEPVTAPIVAARCTRSRVTSLALGSSHTCALYNGGFVRCWGNNALGQLGLGHTNPEGNNKPYQLTNASNGLAGPIAFAGTAGVTAIAAGVDVSCALFSDGSVQCWGNNDAGQLGLGSVTPPSSATPSLVNLGGAATSISVSSGLGLACAVLSGGSVRCWGSNAGGSLGLGNNTAFPSMTMTPSQFGPISLGGTATAVSTGSGACALLTDGTIRCWGDNNFGELGLGNKTQVSATMVPSAYGVVPLIATRTALSVSLGSAFACSRLSDGSAQCWGLNNAGQLGLGNANVIGDNELASTGVVVLGTTVTSIVSGVNATCAFFTSDGGLRCWGDNSGGQLGYPDTTPRGGTGTTTPSQLGAVSFGAGRTAVAVFPGNNDTCALLDDNEVRCWGSNGSGQLGLGMVSSNPDFVGGTPTTAPSNAAVTTVQVLPP